jgi:murein DD-endopeptidase MepM/ murein hydrolase activator NlpD
VTPTITLNVQPPDLASVQEIAVANGIPRLALLHTNIPTRPREEIEIYTVEEGDTIFGIAEKFGLQPQTVLWGNYFTLLDNPSFLRPGEVLNILPTDGTYHKWSAGEGLNGVSEYYKVRPEDIINYPPNKLKAEEIGDFAHPNIKPDTWLIVPGGIREFVNWSAPRITRDDPSVAKVLGAGSCGPVTDGPIGTGGFIWPTNDHTLSGFDYSPQTNHFGIDLNGETGNPIYATDNGVIVYSGWNDWGYGYMVVIDHGNGWQSLYAHLSEIYAGCGEWINQGQTIALMGSTGRSSGSHLHFEMMSDSGGKVNPKDFLY